jgi:hypothetical protein
MIRYVKIRKYERGLMYRDKEFRKVLRPGRHAFFNPLFRVNIVVLSVRDVWLPTRDLDVIVRSGELAGEIEVMDLKDHQRGLVWVDGRFEGLYGAGLRALWTVFHKVRVEIVDARDGRLERADLSVILANDTASRLLDEVQVEQNQVALLKVDGRQQEILRPGRYPTGVVWRVSRRARSTCVSRCWMFPARS